MKTAALFIQSDVKRIGIDGVLLLFEARLKATAAPFFDGVLLLGKTDGKMTPRDVRFRGVKRTPQVSAVAAAYDRACVKTRR